MFFITFGLLWVLCYVALRLARQRGRLAEDLDRDVLALGALAVLAIGYFWRPLLAGDVWMPADGGDLASFLYPTYKFAAASFRQGSIPLWNPHLYGGMTFIGDIQSGLLYPIYWLLYLLTPNLTYRVLEGVAALHVAIAGATMYLALRFIRPREAAGGRIRRLAALVGAVAFMFSDLFVVHFGNLNLIAVAAWLPLVFVLFHRALADRRPGLAAASGLVLAVATLAGHIQITLFIALLLGFRTLWEIVGRLRGRAGRATAAPAAYLALAGFVALGLCAPILLPFAQHIGFTERAAWSYGDTVKYSLAPGQFIELLVPTFFGRGPGIHWGLWDRIEAGYIGILPLMLAGVAVALRRERLVRFLVGLTVAGFLVAMGLYALAHGWMYELLPGFGLLRAPARFALLFDFGLAGLAALGLDALLRPLSRLARRALRVLWRALPGVAVAGALMLWAVVYLALLTSQDKDPNIFLRLSVAANGVGLLVLFVLAGLALIGARRYGQIRPAALGLLSLGLVFFDLSSTGAYIDLGTLNPTAMYDQAPIVGFLRSDPELYRIDPRTDIDQLWQPDTAVVDGLYDVWGVANPSVGADWNRYWSGLGSRSTPLYDALNAKYVIAKKDVVLDWNRFTLAFDGDPTLNVYRNGAAFPRAWLVHRVQPAPNHEAAYQAIHAAGFDPRTSAVVEEAPALDVPASGTDTVSVELRGPNRIVATVDAGAEGLLVLSEVYYPGWRATVDGKPAAITRTDFLFRGVRVPAGHSTVTLVYAPLTWTLGLGVALLTLVLLAGWAWLRRRRT